MTETAPDRYFTSRTTGRKFVYCRYESLDKSGAGGFVLYDREEAEAWAERRNREMRQYGYRYWVEPQLLRQRPTDRVRGSRGVLNSCSLKFGLAAMKSATVTTRV